MVFFGGTSFSQGFLYLNIVGYFLNSHFAIAPEGDRHLDTFRLWEAFTCGCIPVVVDFRYIPLPIGGLSTTNLRNLETSFGRCTQHSNK